MAAPVTVHREDDLAVVTVDAPPLNLFDGPVGAALVAAVDEMERTRPRAVLFRFEGKLVTGGVDVRVFDALDRAGATDLFAALVSVAQRVAALPCPTVFAAHSTCLTWGFELALACDLIVASERAQFGLVEATVGLTPAMGGTQRLAERAGTGRARELARRLAAGPTVAHAATKAVLRAYLDGGVAQADADVPALAGALFDTADLRTALATFLTYGPGHAVFDGR